MFFDYDQDLATFDSLMTEIDGDTNLLEADEEEPVKTAPAEKEAGSDESPETRIKGSVVTAAIDKALNPGSYARSTWKNNPANKLRMKVFRNAYSTPKPLTLATTEDGIKIVDDKNATSYFEKKDDSTIIVNFSKLVRMLAPPSLDTDIKKKGDWSKVTSDVVRSNYQRAIDNALNKLEKIIDSGIFDVGAPENQKGYKKPKDNPDDNAKQSPPPDEDDNVEPPTDEPENVEPPADEDQRAIYQQILKDFRETYQMQLEADCDARKAEIAGGGNESDDPDEQSEATSVRDELVNGCYEPLMKPYAEKADDDTKTKVKRVVTFYVDKYLGKQETDKKTDKKTEGEGGGEGNTSSSSSESEPKKPGGSWYANTMADMKNKDYHNHQLYVNPKLQGHSDAYNKYKDYLEKKKAQKAQEKANKNVQQAEESKPAQTPAKKQQPKKDEMDWS